MNRLFLFLMAIAVSVQALSSCTDDEDDVLSPTQEVDVEFSTPRPMSVSILGDSYSTFEGWMTPDTNKVFYYAAGRPQNDVRHVKQMWWHILTHRADSAFVLLTNNSYAGSTICNTGYGGADASALSFVTRMNEIGSGMDFIIIQGAVNDSWANSPIGKFKYDDFSNDDLKCFRPALAYLFASLGKAHPQASLVFVLSDGLSDAISSSVSTICQHYGVCLVKLSSIPKQEGHPSITGQAAIAVSVAQSIRRSCLEK